MTINKVQRQINTKLEIDGILLTMVDIRTNYVREISGKNIALSSYDEIFSTEESRVEGEREKVQMVALGELHPFRNHPFKAKDDEAMAHTVESVKRYGVLVPAIVRAREAGGYIIGISSERSDSCAECYARCLLWEGLSYGGLTERAFE